MPRNYFHKTALDLAKIIASRSTCARSTGQKQRGAIATDGNNCIVSMGYNGVPRGFVHCIDSPCKGALQPSGGSASDDCMAVHAEINCIINSVSPQSIVRLYLTHSPCFKCALALANLVNLEEVYYEEEYGDARGLEVLKKTDLRIYTFDNFGTLKIVH